MELYQKICSAPFFIAGPCVMESYELMDEIASALVEIKKRLNVEVIFKASFDKANRTSIHSFRGPGLEKGMIWLSDIRSKYNIPVTTDIHESYQAKPVGQVVDILQIPAFLCRQTDLLVEAARTGKIVNVKKAQFLSATDMQYPAGKILECENTQIMLTERGTIMSPGNLVVDFRNIPEMKKLGYPVVMDCTHAVQKPSTGTTTGGNREYVRPIALAAKAFGANGYFLEVHPEPDKGLSDAPNMYPLDKLENLILELI
jgi:2-dehydro-3-deoxyphosphooctonate aldolase (KDO 8-P synthase)